MGDRTLTRREFAARLGAGAMAGMAAGPLAAQAAEGSSDRPNIVVIVTDDQRYDCLGVLGNPILKTPHLDALARDGALFTNAFCTSSVCCSSRASLLTGTYNRTNGIHTFQQDLSPDMLGLSYPVLLREAGYRTAFVGKYGVGENMPAEAFDYWRGIPGQGTYFYGEGNEQVHSTDLMCDQALGFLDTCTGDRPFCLSISFKAPHAMDYDPRPFQPAPRHESLYADTEIPPPPTAGREHFEALPDFLKTSEGRKRWEHNFGTPAVYQRNMRDYYRLLTQVDEAVGRLRQAVDDRGWGGRTVFVYTSDNGYLVGDYGLEGKWYAYEPSIRVPLLVYDPRARAGVRVEGMALNIDVSPTVLDLAGVTVPGGVQGTSLAPWLDGDGPQEIRESWFYEHLLPHEGIPKSEGVRTRRWKYIRWIDRSPVREELYDLQEDPLERTNLAESRGGILESMRTLWAEYVERLTPQAAG